MLSISFSQVRAAGTACDRGYSQGSILASKLGIKEGQPVELTRILEELGVNNTLWCLGQVKASFKSKAERVLMDYIEACFDVLQKCPLSNSQAVRQKEYIMRRYNCVTAAWQKAIDISAAMPRAVSVGKDDASERYNAETERQYNILLALLQELT